MRVSTVENTLSWAHQNGYAFSSQAIFDYCYQVGCYAAEHMEGFVSFHDGGNVPRFTKVIGTPAD